MLDTLAPARRRLFLVVTGVLVLALVAGAVVLVLQARADRVTPVAQDAQGPVLLVPGYGGDTSSLSVLAEALRKHGRDVVLVDPPGNGTGDLRAQAEHLARVASETIASSGAGSVDVVGYSAGGVVVRLWVADLGGGDVVRRAITLASPQHGTDLAGLAGDLAPDACPEACRQLATNSELIRGLNADDETPAGPRWVALWTTDDKTVVPPDSGALDGAVSFSLQSVCPDLTVSHGDVPRTPAVIAIVEQELGTATPEVPGSSVC